MLGTAFWKKGATSKAPWSFGGNCIKFTLLYPTSVRKCWRFAKVKDLN